MADTKVKKKLHAILASWNTQFKNDPSLASISGLYRYARPSDRRSHARSESADARLSPAGLSPNDKDAAKKRAKREKEEAKERARKAEQEARQNKHRPRRSLFNFEAVSSAHPLSTHCSHPRQEKPQILTSIANASQASSNLVNAITLVNRDKESIIANARVQECLESAKAARKTIVRYIQVTSSYKGHLPSRNVL